MNANEILKFLDDSDVQYQKVEHPSVHTVEEAEQLVPAMFGMHIKNLLLKDKGEKNLFLLVVEGQKRVDLKALSKVLNITKLSFASVDTLMKYLGVEPGAVTLLGVANDKDHNVQVLFDEPVWQAEALQCRPLVNTATLAIPHEGINKFLIATRHEAKIINVPERA